MKLIIFFLIVSCVFFNKANAANACAVEIEFSSMPTKKQQQVKVSEGINLVMVQLLAEKSMQGAKIASNFICQKMLGAQYTGSAQEWQKFINSAVSALEKSGYSDVQFIPVTPKNKLYKTELMSIEYKLLATISGNKQVIQNLAVLDKVKNTVYTISVSGNEKVEREVFKEFSNLANSFSPKS